MEQVNVPNDLGAAAQVATIGRGGAEPRPCELVLQGAAMSCQSRLAGPSPVSGDSATVRCVGVGMARVFEFAKRRV